MRTFRHSARTTDTSAIHLNNSIINKIHPNDGTTSPEELIAAAHSSCFSMALSHGLTTAGNAPTSLDVTADVTLGQDDTGFAVTSIVLTVTGVVPGIDADAFTAAAEGAKAGCPISQALAGVADISVVATLA